MGEVSAGEKGCRKGQNGEKRGENPTKTGRVGERLLCASKPQECYSCPERCLRRVVNPLPTPVSQRLEASLSDINVHDRMAGRRVSTLRRVSLT